MPCLTLSRKKRQKKLKNITCINERNGYMIDKENGYGRYVNIREI